jgi:hypothetical protein
MIRLSITRTKGPDTVAECDNCDRLRADATIQRVHYHVRATGHTVRVIASLTTTYRPGEAS